MSDGTIVEATPNTVPSVWSTLGAKKEFAPRTARELRLWVVAMDGAGKTTFLSSIPRNLVLDFDHAAETVVSPESTRIAVEGWDHYKEIREQLRKDAKADGKGPFDRVTYDTVEEFAGMMAIQLQTEKGVEDIGEYGSSGAGWRLVRDRCWSDVRELENLGYAWAMSGHLALKTEKIAGQKQEITRLVETIFPTLGGRIRSKADFKITLFPKSETIQVSHPTKLANGTTIDKPSMETVDRVFLDCAKTSASEGKSRAVSTMQKRFPVPKIGGWAEFERRYNEAIEEEKKLQHQQK